MILGSLTEEQLKNPDTKLNITGKKSSIKLGDVYEENSGFSYYSVSATPTNPSRFTYEMNNDGTNTITITGFSPEYVSTYYSYYGNQDSFTSAPKVDELVIPYMINNQLVTRVNWNEKFHKDSISSSTPVYPNLVKRLVMPNTLISYQLDAVTDDNWNGYLEEIVFSNKLTSIATSYLSNTFNLNNVTIPSSVQSLNQRCFCYSGLTSANLLERC